MRRFLLFVLVVGLALAEESAEQVKDEYNQIKEDDGSFQKAEEAMEEEEKEWEGEVGHHKDNIFDLLQEHVFGPFLEGLEDDPVWKDLLNMDTKPWTLNSDIQAVLDHFGSKNSAICGGECDSDQAFIFGCNCRNTFYALKRGTCQKMLCKSFDYFSENGAELFKKVKYAKSLKDIASAAMDFLEPYQKDFCKCRSELAGAIQSCAENYDGQIGNATEIQEAARAMDLGSVLKVMKSGAMGFCKQGCRSELSDMLVSFVEMIDNSLQNSEDECSHMRHISDTVYNLIDNVVTYADEAESASDIVNFVLRRATSVPKDWWCGREECVKDLNEKFNSCCYLQMMKKAPNRRNNLERIFGLVNGFMEEDDQLVIKKKTYSMVHKMLMPDKVCDMDFYKQPSCSKDLEMEMEE